MIKPDPDWPRVSRIPEMPKPTKRVSPDLPAVYLLKKRSWLRQCGIYAWAAWAGGGFSAVTTYGLDDWQFWAFFLPLLLLVSLHTTIVTDAVRASCSGIHHD